APRLRRGLGSGRGAFAVVRGRGVRSGRAVWARGPAGREAEGRRAPGGPSRGGAGRGARSGPPNGRRAPGGPSRGGAGRGAAPVRGIASPSQRPVSPPAVRGRPVRTARPYPRPPGGAGGRP